MYEWIPSLFRCGPITHDTSTMRDNLLRKTHFSMTVPQPHFRHVRLLLLYMCLCCSEILLEIVIIRWWALAVKSLVTFLLQWRKRSIDQHHYIPSWPLPMFNLITGNHQRTEPLYMNTRDEVRSRKQNQNRPSSYRGAQRNYPNRVVLSDIIFLSFRDGSIILDKYTLVSSTHPIF